MVLASNRGRYLSKTLRLVEWCVFLTPLEPFFKDNSPLPSRFRISPHTLPHIGRGADFKSSFVHKGFVAFRLGVPSPTSVGFAAHAAVGLRAAKRPCSPKTSLVADATNGFTHGRVISLKDRFVPCDRVHFSVPRHELVRALS